VTVLARSCKPRIGSICDPWGRKLAEPGHHRNTCLTRAIGTRSDQYPCHLGITTCDFVTGWKLHEPRGTPSLMLAHPKRLVSSLLCCGEKGGK
jgi:hypothetical protein